MTLENIILEARKGKRNAQNAVIELLWNKVYNYVYGKIRNEEEAEDVAIETFTKVFTKLKLYNEDFDFTTWVISIAHNTMIDHIRKSPKLSISIDDETNLLEILEDQPSPEEYLILKQDNDKLNKAIAKLRDPYQKIIELRYIEDKTYKEIAEELNLTLPNVKVRLLRAKQLLMEIMQNNI
ncbi:RNA polymerase sigma-70 factor, ECF subfamily [Algoriella xinjiangensis]|uniref:RNA polymerase sigma-70 factor, ECF subfamily n=1 Tax=Algoriella xinjiangensis TaxID=684065 RepID=A0A1I4WJ12_9FLAO|nr:MULTISPECIES: RNA polymerase sigma factor [Algoriella]MBO6211669.1 RNA polymerase sigma factor [Algoriella sp.]SFN13771.1 RNA polymerase sigma-70 factor, ECF subfamily [Algoriella xinjiangensis]VDH16888.1 RNA polymerase sigma factor sigM [Algoriella xinjiangensis]